MTVAMSLTLVLKVQLPYRGPSLTETERSVSSASASASAGDKALPRQIQALLVQLLY